MDKNNYYMDFSRGKKSGDRLPPYDRLERQIKTGPHALEAVTVYRVCIRVNTQNRQNRRTTPPAMAFLEY